MPRLSSTFFEFPRFGGRERARLRVRFINPHTKQTQIWDCIVDSGADRSVLPGHLATGLGHNLKGAGVKSDVMTGLGGIQPVWRHTFILEILNGRNQVAWRSRRVLIDCADNNMIPPLLGVDDILSNFRLVLDYPQKKVCLSW